MANKVKKLPTTPVDDGSDVSGESSERVRDANRRTRIAQANWARYEYVRDRGHPDYCMRARRLVELYMGGGLHWRQADRDAMEEEDRYPLEINETGMAVDTALGYQIHNRVSIMLAPKRFASTQSAEKMTKVVMKKHDDMQYAWHESQMYGDGLVEQRGYMDLRVYYDENINGEPGLFIYDPADVIPDPDAKSYDPDDWADVTVTRWFSADEIELDYGEEARKQVESQYGRGEGDEDFGEDIDDVPRNSFSTAEDPSFRQGNFDAVDYSSVIPRYRVVDRQYWKIKKDTQIAVFPTGDIRVIEDAGESVMRYCYEQGALLIKRPMRRVRWTVSTENVLLHDEWSPYEHFTVIPYFPKFKRGMTRGMVDDLEGPQELMDSSITTVNQIVRNTANSGFYVEENSLTNMSTEDLQHEGARNGVVIEYRTGAAKPEKIEPNKVPEGVANLVEFASAKIAKVSGQTDQARAEGGKAQSGLSVQAQQYGAQIPMAPKLENLAHTRRLFHIRLIKMLQQTLTLPQIITITENGPDGKPADRQIYLNQQNPNEPTDEFFDPTLGEYAFTITEQQNHITFQNSQFEAALAMRKEGIALPDEEVVKNSPLFDKPEILKTMAERQNQQDPLKDAEVLLKNAQAEYAKANAIAKRVEALFSGMRTAEASATNPALAPAADAIVQSAGYVDSDAPPIYPNNVAAPVVATPPPNNTNPLTPDNPDRGMNAGIEAGPTGGQ